MKTVLTKGHAPLPIEAEIRARIESGRSDTLLQIVPTAQARSKRQRESLAYAPNRAVAGLHIHTLEDLIQRLYGYIGERKSTISRGLQMVWLREIVDQQPLTSLKPYAEIAVSHGTVTQLVNTINQLKTSGILPSDLQPDLSDSESTEYDKLSELVVIYEAYERKLGDQWIDDGGIHRAVASSDETHTLIETAFPSVNLVVVEDFDVFSRPDFDTLARIAQSPQIGMAIIFDFNEQNESLFGHVKENSDGFISCGFQQAKETEADNSSISHFSANLFHKDRWLQSAVEKLDLTQQVTLLQASDRAREVELTARLIKQLTSTKPGFVLDQLCVTYHNPKVYAPLIREIFPLYGIPYSSDLGGSLSDSPLVTAIFALLQAIANPTDRQNWHKVEQSPYFAIDVGAFTDVGGLIDKSPLKGQMSPETFQQALDRLLETVQVRQQILNRAGIPPTIIAQEAGAYRDFRSLINELVNHLRQEYGTESKHSFTAYINWLRLMATEASYHAQAPNTDGVRILSLVQTKMLDFDVVILGGLVDGEFPAAFHPDPLLPPNRSATEPEQLRENRFLFYQVFKCFRSHLYLTVPQTNEGVELVSSPFINELQRVAEIEVLENWDTGQFGDLADENSVQLSAEGFLKHYGKFVWETQEVPDLPAPDTANQVLASTVCPLIEHNIRIERSRAHTHALPQYEGTLTPNLLSPLSHCTLEGYRQRTYSASQLESYGRCPFQYFSDYLLNLSQKDDDDDEGLTALEKGDILHKILFEFYDTRRDKPPICEDTDAAFDEAIIQLKQIAEKHLKTVGKQGLFWEIDVEMLIGGHGRLGILPTFLEVERARNFEVQPRHFEVWFGSGHMPAQVDSHLSSTEAVTVGDIRLRGKIDRIELGDGIFTIGDYKTGSYLPKINDILEGRSLQLPLYLAVAEQLLRKSNPDPVKKTGAVYYTLRDDCKVELGAGDKEYSGIAFKKDRSGQLLPNAKKGVENLKSLVDIVIEHANRYVASISKGEFPLTSHDQKEVCGYCSFKRICRVGAFDETEAGS